MNPKKKIIIPRSPSKGTLLISKPFMQDPNFKRTVLLITDHTKEGSIGFVLNKPSLLTLNEVLRDFPPFETMTYLGGPVQQETLHFIHKCKLLKSESIQISENLWWGGNYDELKFLAAVGEIQPSDFRFFLGYSGWGAGQLEQEIESNSWILSKASPEIIFPTISDQLWKQALENMGSKYAKLVSYPENPAWN